MIFDEEAIDRINKADFDYRKLFPLSYLLMFVSFLLSFRNLLLASLLFLFSLRLPYVVVWLVSREKERRLKKDLPLFLSVLSWTISYYPLPKAIEKSGVGEFEEICKRFYRRYSSGEPFEKALTEFSRFDSLSDLSDLLVSIYRTGGGEKILKTMSERFSIMRLKETREKAARLQIFSTAYVSFAAILPAIGSSLSFISISSDKFLLLSLILSAGLVVLWKVIE